MCPLSTFENRMTARRGERSIVTILQKNGAMNRLITAFILLHEKFLRFDWLRAVVFQLNLKYLHVKITNLLRVVV